MLKRKEIEASSSCLNNAEDDEPIFVLKSTDELAPGIVREWAERYRKSKLEARVFDGRRQAKYAEACSLADQMDEWRKARALSEDAT